MGLSIGEQEQEMAALEQGEGVGGPETAGQEARIRSQADLGRTACHCCCALFVRGKSPA